MSTYEVPTAGSLTLDEQYIYGSSRLGVLRNEVRSYELTDHLGNVRSAIGELKDANNQVEVISATDYYPFGMIAKAYNSQNYRYGFNRMEKDDELKGSGNSYDFGARIYDPRVARWLSIDPIAKKYPELTPYHFAANNPILYVDDDGNDFIVFIETNTHTTSKFVGEDRVMSNTSTSTEIQYVVIKHPGEDQFFYQTTEVYKEKTTVDPNCSTCGKGSEMHETKRETSYKEFYPIMDGRVNERYSSGLTKTGIWPFEFYDNDYLTLAKLAPDDLKKYLEGKNRQLYRMLKHRDTEYKITQYGLTAYLAIDAAIGLAPGIQSIIQNAKGANLVKIGTVDRDVMTFSSKIGEETVEGITNFRVADGKLYLEGLHLQGSSAGKVGREAMWNMAKDLGKQFDVSEVIIQGGRGLRENIKVQHLLLLQLK